MASPISPNKAPLHFEGMLNSYSQIFFAKNKWFGILLIVASFINPVIGISGLLTVFCTNIIADIFSLNPSFIKEGLFGFSSAMLGMGIDAFFQMNVFFFILITIASILSILMTLAFQGLLNKYQLPF